MSVPSLWPARRKPLVAVTAIAIMASLAACSSSGSSSGGSTSGVSADGGSTVASTGAGASGSPINIGVLGAFSGPLAAAAVPTRDGVLAWVNTVNASGGINGHPVKAYVEDDKGDPATSTQALRTLVETDHVVALVGPYANNTEGVWASYLQSHGVPVVGGSQATDIWTTSPMYYGVGNGVDIRSIAMAYGPTQDGASKAFGMYCVEVANCKTALAQVQSYASKVGVEWKGSVAVSVTSANYASVCLQAKNSGATAMPVFLPPSDFDRVVQACHQQGFDPIYAANAGALTSTSLTTSFLQGHLFAYLNAFPLDIPAASDYLKAMAKYSPKVDLNANTGQIGWTAGALFGTALKNISPSTTVTSTDVVNGLNSITADDLGGLLPQPITFKKGEPHAALSCIFTAHLKDDKLATDPKPLCQDTALSGVPG